MKKILFYCVAPLALSMGSCSMNDAGELYPASPQPISFATYMGVASKGIDASTLTLKDDGFLLRARLTADGTEFMDERSVGYETDLWSYDGDLMYWPESGSIDFFAYSGDITFSFNEQDDPTFSYTTEQSGSDQTDAIIAYNYSELGDDGVVTLIFQHALSKVTSQVTANTSDENIDLCIYDITYASVDTEGVCTIDTGVSIDWSDLSTSVDVSLELLDSVVDDGITGGDNPEASDVCEGANDLIIIPQTLGTVTIKGEWKQNGVVIESFATTGKSVDLDKELVADSYYTINFIITPNISTISFIASVEDWTEEDDEDYDTDEDEDD